MPAVCRSNIELRCLSWGYAAWRYSLVTPVTAGLRRMDHRSVSSAARGVGWVSVSGGALSPGLVRAVEVVVDQVLAEHPGQVLFTEDQDPFEEFAAEGTDDGFADAFIRRVRGIIVMIRSPSALNTCRARKLGQHSDLRRFDAVEPTGCPAYRLIPRDIDHPGSSNGSNMQLPKRTSEEFFQGATAGHHGPSTAYAQRRMAMFARGLLGWRGTVRH
jgi:hypothetical protein